MPEGWEPNLDAFLDGLQFGVYVALAALLVLVTITAIRRVLAV